MNKTESMKWQTESYPVKVAFEAESAKTRSGWLAGGLEVA